MFHCVTLFRAPFRGDSVVLENTQCYAIWSIVPSGICNSANFQLKQTFSSCWKITSKLHILRSTAAANLAVLHVFLSIFSMRHQKTVRQARGVANDIQLQVSRGAVHTAQHVQRVHHISYLNTKAVCFTVSHFSAHYLEVIPLSLKIRNPMKYDR